MKRTVIKILSLAICATLLLSAAGTFGAGAAYAAEGSCGENLSWRLDSGAKTLTITGTGDMFDYEGYEEHYIGGNTSPWFGYENLYDTVIIEDGVTGIGSYAFYWSAAKTVIIGNDVSRIGEAAFVECEMTSLTLGSSLKIITNGAFAYCRNLKSLEIPDSVKEIDDMVFSCCKRLKSVAVGSSVRRIGMGAFFECPALEEVTLPASLLKVEDGAFDLCPRLCRVNYNGCESRWNRITVEENNESLTGAEILFNDRVCDHVRELSIVPADCTENGVKVYTCVICGDVLQVQGDSAGHIYDGEKCLRCGAIAPAHEFLSGTCGEGVLWTLDKTDGTLLVHGSGAMDDYEMGGKKTVNTPWYPYYGTVKKVVVSDGVEYIGTNSFAFCPAETVIMADSVKIIGSSAFVACEMRSLTLGASLEMIDMGAFSGCEYLEEVVIPDKADVADGFIFSECTSLAYVSMGESLSYVGDGLFYDCENLRTVKLSASVTSIYEAAFSGCSALSDIIYASTPENFGEIVTEDENEALSGALITFLGEGCAHQWEKSFVAADCLRHGYDVSVCTLCGKTEKIYIPALGHTAAEVIITKPTCTARGTARSECSVCGEPLGEYLLNPAGHDYKDSVCFVCGYKLIGDINRDGKLNTIDSALLRRIILGIIEVEDGRDIFDDLNGDGKYNLVDSALLRRKILGITD